MQVRPFTPTEEQKAIGEAVRNGKGSLAINAGAGTGKTSTLLYLVRDVIPQISSKDVLMCVFNTRNKEDLQKKLDAANLRKAKAKTFNGLAMSAYTSKYKNQMQDFQFEIDTSKYSRIARWWVKRNLPEERDPQQIKEAVDFLGDLFHFFCCNTTRDHATGDLMLFIGGSLEDDESLVPHEIGNAWDIVGRYGLNLDYDDGLEFIRDDTSALVEKGLPALLEMGRLAFHDPKKAAETLKDEEGKLLFGDLEIGKAWIDFSDMVYWCVVEGWRCWAYSWVMVDEAQDLSPLQRALVNQHLYRGGRLIMVGDPQQCVIDGTIIGDVAAQDLKAGDMITAAAGRGTTRTLPIAEAFHRQVENEPVVTIRTAQGRQITTTLNHTHFADFVPSMGSDDQFYTYLMYRRSHGYRVGVTRKQRSGTDGKPVLGFKARSIQEKADAMWVLKVSKTEGAARWWEAYFAAKYGLPTITYRAIPGTASKSGLMLTQPEINRLFENLDTETPALHLLDDLRLNINAPHHRPRAMNPDRARNITLTLCMDTRGKAFLHGLELYGTGDVDARLLNLIGGSLKPSGTHSWRFRRYSTDYTEMQDLANRIKAICGANIGQNAAFGVGISLPFMPASNVMPGMMMYIENADGTVGLDEVVDVEHGLYTGGLHDFNISGAYNYSANGIITHNCINAWNGADNNGWENSQVFWGVKTAKPLSICWRCCKEVVELAKGWKHDFQAAPNAVSGKIIQIHDDDVIKMIKDGDAIISRLRSATVVWWRKLVKAGIAAKIIGQNPAEVVVRMLEKIAAQKEFEFKKLHDWINKYELDRVKKLTDKNRPEHEVLAFQDEMATVRAMCEDVEAKTLEDLIAKIRDELDPKKMPNGGVLIMTGHTSKGGEWPAVYCVTPDKFPLVTRDQSDDDYIQEKNLEYVMQTRAISQLTFVSPQNQPYDPNAPKAAIVPRDSAVVPSYDTSLPNPFADVVDDDEYYEDEVPTIFEMTPSMMAQAARMAAEPVPPILIEKEEIPLLPASTAPVADEDMIELEVSPKGEKPKTGPLPLLTIDESVPVKDIPYDLGAAVFHRGKAARVTAVQPTARRVHYVGPNNPPYMWPKTEELMTRERSPLPTTPVLLLKGVGLGPMDTDMISITEDGRTDKGAEHRAFAVARLLAEMDLWDGFKTRIRIADPYTIHDALGDRYVSLSMEHGELLVRLAAAPVADPAPIVSPTPDPIPVAATVMLEPAVVETASLVKPMPESPFRASGNLAKDMKDAKLAKQNKLFEIISKLNLEQTDIMIELLQQHKEELEADAEPELT